jgi:hypothetical protein
VAKTFTYLPLFWRQQIPRAFGLHCRFPDASRGGLSFYFILSGLLLDFSSFCGRGEIGGLRFTEGWSSISRVLTIGEV